MNYKELAQGVVEGVWAKSSELISDTVVKKTKEALNCLKVDLGIAFNKYLEKSYEKYSTAKTLLYRDKPRPVRKFFVIPTLKTSGEELIHVNGTRDIFNFAQGSHHRFIIVRGTGGIGKSMLMKHLFLSELDDCDLIPVLVELKDINDQESGYDLVDVLFENLDILGTSVAKSAIEYALKRGMFLLLLDGYDEIRSEKMPDFLKKLNNLCDKYPKNHVVVSARPTGDFVEFRKFAVLDTTGLDKPQALELIQKLEYDKTIKQRFIDALDKELYEKHDTFASNPLLLTMMFLTYDENARIPDELHLFYERAFETLLTKHDATKGGYTRKVESKLPQHHFKTVFATFCCITYYNGQLRFSHDQLISILSKVKAEVAGMGIDFNPVDYVLDLTNYVCMLYRDGFEYAFTHRSFQEYFTAVYLKDQVDDVIKKRGLKIIKADLHKAVDDNVFHMFRDMVPDKYEMNILLPLLQEIEKDFIGGSKYDFYFKGFVKDIVFREGRLTIMIIEYNLILVVDRLLPILHTYDYDGDKSTVDELRQHLKDDGGMERHIVEKDDEIGYKLLKETWIGARVLRLSEERERLEKKFASTMDDDDFFSL